LVAEDTELVWLPKKNFSFREGVPLALTKIVNGMISDNGKFVAPAARALARPRISSGTTIPGATTWAVSPVSTTNTGTLFQVQVKIDTSSAGFTTTPEYFASLQGRLTSIDSKGAIQVFCLHFDHIERMRIDGFAFSFFIAVIDTSTLMVEKQIRKFLDRQTAYVSWLAVERNPGDSFSGLTR